MSATGGGGFYFGHIYGAGGHSFDRMLVTDLQSSREDFIVVVVFINISASNYDRAVKLKYL